MAPSKENMSSRPDSLQEAMAVFLRWKIPTDLNQNLNYSLSVTERLSLLGIKYIEVYRFDTQLPAQDGDPKFN